MPRSASRPATALAWAARWGVSALLSTQRKAMASPTAKVMRGGVRVEIPSADVVPGDIVLLEAGDMVVADGRVLEN